jgi:hypothetical protein
LKPISTAVLDSIEEALTQVHSTLTKQVETVSALVKDAELASELIRTGCEHLLLAMATLDRTRQLKRSVGEQRAILATLQATLRGLTRSPSELH